MTTHEVLVAARNLLDRKGWAQLGRDNCWTWEKGYGSTCAHNALMECDGNQLSVAYNGAVAALLLEIDGQIVSDIFIWNDTPSRT
jgi:hypothetical protein